MKQPVSGAFYGIAVSVERLGRALSELSIVVAGVTHIVFNSIPIFRRAKIEAELGYRVPNWVWQVMEYRRRTEGSGNGREIRQ